jgi:hypothetical protein
MESLPLLSYTQSFVHEQKYGKVSDTAWDVIVADKANRLPQVAEDQEKQEEDPMSQPGEEGMDYGFENEDDIADDDQARPDWLIPGIVGLDGSIDWETGNSVLPLFPDHEQSISVHIFCVLMYAGVSGAKRSQSIINLILLLLRIVIQSLGIHHNIPESATDAMTFLKPRSMRVKYDYCRSGCVIFRNNFKDVRVCPVCKLPRFKPCFHKKCPSHDFVNATAAAKACPHTGVNARRPFTTVDYLPVHVRLGMLLGNFLTAHAVRYPEKRTHVPGGVMQDITDSPQWKEQMTAEFLSTCDIAIGMCISGDGFCPYKRTVISFWPILGQFLNLPPWLRARFALMCLFGVFELQAGLPRYELFWNLITEQLNYLHDVGVSLFDARSNRVVRVKLVLIFETGDTRAIEKSLNIQGGGAIYGCLICEFCGEYNPHLCKVVYGNTRRFLPKNHPLRKVGLQPVNDCCFVAPEHRGRPQPRTVDRLKQCIQILEGEEAVKDGVTAVNGVKGRSCSEGLTYGPGHQSYFYAQDGMHAFGNVGTGVLSVLKGERGSGDKSKAAEKEAGRFLHWSSPAVIPGDATAATKSEMKAAAQPRWVLPQAQQDVADDRADKLLRMPPNTDKVGRIFKYLSSRKTAHIFTFMRSLAVFCLDGLGDASITGAVLELFTVMSLLTAHDVLLLEVDLLEVRLIECLCVLEGRLPLDTFVSTFHNLVHIPDMLRKFGPLRGFWMFPFERSMHELTQFLMNNRHPVQSIINNYTSAILVEFWLTRDLVSLQGIADDAVSSCDSARGKRALQGAVKGIFKTSAESYMDDGLGTASVTNATGVVGKALAKVHVFNELELQALRVYLGENSPHNSRYSTLYHKWQVEYAAAARARKARSQRARQRQGQQRRRRRHVSGAGLQVGTSVPHWRTGKWRPVPCDPDTDAFLANCVPCIGARHCKALVRGVHIQTQAGSATRKRDDPATGGNKSIYGWVSASFVEIDMSKRPPEKLVNKYYGPVEYFVRVTCFGNVLDLAQVCFYKSSVFSALNPSASIIDTSRGVYRYYVWLLVVRVCTDGRSSSCCFVATVILSPCSSSMQQGSSSGGRLIMLTNYGC